MQSLSPEERLRDAVMGLNQETRWNRWDIAMQRVAPTYQQQFRAAHAAWGKELQIADTEVTGMTRDSEEKRAISTVTIRWYHQNSMLISDTVVRQTWKKHKQSFLLIDEVIESGHPGLLAFVDIQAVPLASRQDQD